MCRSFLSLKLLLLLTCSKSGGAFSVNQNILSTRSAQPSKQELAAGRGWGNDDFLNSLGGDDEERSAETEKYQEFKRTRENFDERQRERMESPAGQQFMQQQREMMARQQEQREALNRDDKDSTGDFFQDLGMGDIPVEGGSRFSSMMRQAAGNGMGRPSMNLGFEQKLAVPLDYVSEDEDENDNVAE
jgi:hypothetical protein